MSKLIKIDSEYKVWIKDVSRKFKQSQIKAAVKVNDEMLRFYWDLGRELDEKKTSYEWGSHFYQQISKDLTDELPDVKSFSPRNLLYMHQFYRLFPDAGITPQVGAQFDETEIMPQVGAQLKQSIVFGIPWGHCKLIIDKCKTDMEKALFYANKTIEHNWSRAVLLNALGTDLYDRQGKAITNFTLTLPAPQSDLAQEITRDPYSFDFLTIRKEYDEKGRTHG